MKTKHGIAGLLAVVTGLTLMALAQEQNPPSTRPDTPYTPNRRVQQPPSIFRRAAAPGGVGKNVTQSQVKSAVPATKPPGQLVAGSQPQASTLNEADPVPLTQDELPLKPSNPTRRLASRPPGVPAEELPSELPPLVPEQRETDAGELPTGPQNPSLNISWIGPAGINVGEETACDIVIRNLGQTLARDVVVQATIPGAVRFVNSEPEPSSVARTIAWQLGQIPPHVERRIHLNVVPEGKGTITATATVTFSSVACANIRIEEPQLALEINAPEQVLVGDPVTYVLTVTNPGSSPTSGVMVSTVVPDGLRHPKGTEIEYEIGTLAPGEARAVQVSVTAVKPGEQHIRGLAYAGVRLKSPAEATVHVVQPELALKIAGPALRYLDREATYTLTAFNPGTATASNVRVVATIPAGFQFVKAGEGGKHDWTSRTVSWFVGQLEPNQAREIQLSLLASGAGQQIIQGTAAAERGLKANAETITQVEGIAALLLEVVDIDDPVEVGAETAYEIRVTNQGSKAATNVQVIAEVPDEMQAMDATGPTAFRIEGQRVIFEPLPKLGPRADASFRVRVRTHEEGDLRFRARMTSDVLRSPVVEEESTKVYKD